MPYNRKGLSQHIDSYELGHYYLISVRCKEDSTIDTTTAPATTAKTASNCLVFLATPLFGNELLFVLIRCEYVKEMITEDINYAKAAETLKTHLGPSRSPIIVKIAEPADDLPGGFEEIGGESATTPSGIPDDRMVMDFPVEMLIEVAEAVQLVTGASGSV